MTDTASAALLKEMLAYLYAAKDGSAEACNLWEKIHAAQGCKECVAKWPDYAASLPAPATGTACMCGHQREHHTAAAFLEDTRAEGMCCRGSDGHGCSCIGFRQLAKLASLPAPAAPEEQWCPRLVLGRPSRYEPMCRHCGEALSQHERVEPSR